jgi:outer membrane immunogenic protein
MKRASHFGIAFSVGVALTALDGQGAVAADMPVKAPLYKSAAPLQNWTGFFIGANAGAGWSRESYATVPGGTLITDPFDGSLGWFQSFTGSSTAGVSGGGQAGFNWQTSNTLVLGVETDIQYYGAIVRNSGAFTSTVPPGTATLLNQFTSRTPWLGTLRGRVGITPDPNVLLYATGGLAYGRENINATVTVNSGGFLVENFPFNMSGTMIGYAVGGGAEWMLPANWSIKAEYLFASLRGNQQQTVATSVLGPAALLTDIMTLSSSRDQLNIVRIGLNYRFGVQLLARN